MVMCLKDDELPTVYRMFSIFFSYDEAHMKWLLKHYFQMEFAARWFVFPEGSCFLLNQNCHRTQNPFPKRNQIIRISK